jgi:hypothetical protein
MQAVLARLDAMDIGEPHFRLWLRVAAVAERAQEPRGHREVAEVDLGELVESLRVHGLPLEAEPQEHLLGLAAICAKLPRADGLHRAAVKRGAHDQ